MNSEIRYFLIAMFFIVACGDDIENDPKINTGIIIDHTCTDLSSIPSEWINTAKSNLHIVYEHTSHGSQIIQGMTGLYTWKGNLFKWNDGVLDGALDIDDCGIVGWANLGDPDFTSFAESTSDYLNNSANSDVNVVFWSWCGDVSSATEANINAYLDSMSDLEKDFPEVTFVYMTGHLDGTGLTGNLHIRNEQIRNYCKSNGKVLYDFADIESYNPDGVYYGDKYPTDGCNYDFNSDGLTSQTGDPATPLNGDRNWALEWQSNHTVNVDWYNCTCAHSQSLNANMKAYAAWWLWSRLAGWDGN